MGSCRGHRARGASPKAGRQRPYVATTEQVWALYDAMPDHLRPAILLGAFVGLRLAETCGLRTTDVDFMRGIVHPAIQYPNDPLKSEISRTAVPIPRSLALELSAHVAAFPGEGEWLLFNEWGDQLPAHAATPLHSGPRRSARADARLPLPRPSGTTSPRC